MKRAMVSLAGRARGCAAAADGGLWSTWRPTMPRRVRTGCGRYKGADSFAPLGSWIAASDNIADSQALTVTIEYFGTLTSNLRRLGTQETAT